MSRLLNLHDSIYFSRWVRNLGDLQLPEPCYQAELEINLDKIGEFGITWFLSNKKVEVSSVKKRIIFRIDDLDLMGIILPVNMNHLSYFEKRLLAKRISQEFCESGVVLTIQDLVGLYELCSSVNQTVTRLLHDWSHEEVDFWSKQKSMQYHRRTNCYYDPWDKDDH